MSPPVGLVQGGPPGLVEAVDVTAGLQQVTDHLQSVLLNPRLLGHAVTGGVHGEVEGGVALGRPLLQLGHGGEGGHQLGAAGEAGAVENGESLGHDGFVDVHIVVVDEVEHQVDVGWMFSRLLCLLTHLQFQLPQKPAAALFGGDERPGDGLIVETGGGGRLGDRLIEDIAGGWRTVLWWRHQTAAVLPWNIHHISRKVSSGEDRENYPAEDETDHPEQEEVEIHPRVRQDGKGFSQLGSHVHRHGRVDVHGQYLKHKAKLMTFTSFDIIFNIFFTNTVSER